MRIQTRIRPQILVKLWDLSTWF